MGRKKKKTFAEPKMLSSRVEKTDLLKIEDLLEEDRVTVQKFLNDVCRLYISGNIHFSGSNLVTGDNDA